MPVPRSWLLCAGVLCFALSAQEEAAPSSEKSGFTRIYTVAELIGQAETILIAQIGETDAKGTRLKVMEVLRRPPAELLGEIPREEQLERARKLLELEAQDRERLVKEKSAPRYDVPKANLALPPIAVIAAQGRLPKEGNQALFLLWERAEPAEGVPVRYKLAHPQCVYDPEYASQVRLALTLRRPEDGERYLREWDRQAAEKLRQREDLQALKNLPSGNSHAGLTLKVAATRASVRGDGTFDVSIRFENERAFDLSIYDGALSGYAVRLRAKDDPPEKAIVLRHTNAQVTAGIDAATLAIQDATDFALVPRQSVLTKELHFDAKEIPALRSLEGVYVVNIVYASTMTGEGVDGLPAAPWTGMLVSTPAEVTLLQTGAGLPEIPKTPAAAEQREKK